MKKSKILLPIYLILSLVIIVSAVVVSLTAGINLGIDFVGGKQIEIQIPEGSNSNEYRETVSDVLVEYGLSVDTSFEEDKFTNTYYVVKINTQELSAEDAEAIRTSLAEKLNLPAENISEVLSISGSVTQQTILYVSIAVLGIFAFLFVAGWLRFGVMNGLAILFGAIHNMIVSFAVILLSRIQLSISACVSVFVLSVVFAGMFALVLEHSREAMLSKAHKDETTHQIYQNSFKKVLLPALIILGATVVFALSSLFVATNTIKLFAVSAIICALVAFYSLHVSSLMGGYLAEIKRVRDKQKLSKNNAD